MKEKQDLHRCNNLNYYWSQEEEHAIKMRIAKFDFAAKFFIILKYYLDQHLMSLA